jgi:hypothetical protein
MKIPAYNSVIFLLRFYHEQHILFTDRYPDSMRITSLIDLFYVIPAPLQDDIKQHLQNCKVRFCVHSRSDHFTTSPGPLSPEPSRKKII